MHLPCPNSLPCMASQPPRRTKVCLLAHSSLPLWIQQHVMQTHGVPPWDIRQEEHSARRWAICSTQQGCRSPAFPAKVPRLQSSQGNIRATPVSISGSALPMLLAVDWSAQGGSAVAWLRCAGGACLLVRGLTLLGTKMRFCVGNVESLPKLPGGMLRRLSLPWLPARPAALPPQQPPAQHPCRSARPPPAVPLPPRCLPRPPLRCCRHRRRSRRRRCRWRAPAP